MKKNFDFNLKNIDGTEAQDVSQKPVLTKNLIINALLNAEAKDGLEKLSRFELAKKLQAGGEQDYSVDELKKIKDLTGQYLPTVVVGQIYNYIEASILRLPPTEILENNE
jgi:hypothetical protein